MKKNMGQTDRMIRIAVAILMVVLYFTGMVSGTVAIVFVILSAVLVLTSYLHFCPLYTLFGMRTCQVPEKKDKA